MRKILFSILFSVLSFSAFAQGTKINIRSSELTKGFQKAGFARIIRPVFEHDGSTLASDSADYNPETNTFDAFGHVVITQPSGTTIYSDLLNYSGNTKLAILTNNVRLIDGDATLTTNYLTYDMGTRMGTYTNGGKIVNDKNVLTSKNGYYFASTRDAYFRYNVVLNSPDALIKTDTLRYNSTSKIAYFYGPTNIYGKDDTLYTENGTYNTTNDQARFGKNNLYTQGSKSMKGDSLFYDRKAGYGRAMGNIIFIDTAERAELRGGIGLYKKLDESILVTQNPYITLITESDSSKTDTIWYTADTLFSKVIYTKDIKPYKKEELKANSEVEDLAAAAPPGPAPVSAPPPAADSLQTIKATNAEAVSPQPSETKKIPPPDIKSKTDSSKVPPKADVPKGIKLVKDSTMKANVKTDSIPSDTSKNRIVIAYRNAKIFKSDLQARADSMFFSYSDSTVRCYGNPMLWAQKSQLTGDTIYLQLKNKKLHNMLLQHNSLIVNSEELDSTNFNQIKGKVITGYFKDNKLDQMFVDGNAEGIYYVKDDTSYVGLNHQISSRMKIRFLDGELNTIDLIRRVDGSLTPMDKVVEEDRILKGFVWKPKDRPKSKEEIIPQLAAKKVPPKTTPPKPPAKTTKPVATGKPVSGTTPPKKSGN